MQKFPPNQINQTNARLNHDKLAVLPDIFDLAEVIEENSLRYLCFQDNKSAHIYLNYVKKLLQPTMAYVATMEVAYTRQCPGKPHVFWLFAEDFDRLKQCVAKDILRIKQKTVLVKTLRADELNYVRDFVDMLIPISKSNRKLPLRPYRKKPFTVNGVGVFERSTKQPQYTPAQKQGYSKPCSTTLVMENVSPRIFGFNRERREKLVGVMISIYDALLTKRLYIYDGGTVGRPYDFDTRDDAQEYFDKKVTGKDNSVAPVLYHDLFEFNKAIADVKHADSYNEVLARLSWNMDGSSKVFIASNTLEARLLAQDYARIIRQRLHRYAVENGIAWDDNYQVPICFYLSSKRRYIEEYTLEVQAADREHAEKICNHRSRKRYDQKCLRIYNKDY